MPRGRPPGSRNGTARQAQNGQVNLRRPAGGS